MGRRYHRKSTAGAMINDTTSIASKLPPSLSLLLGAVLFSIFYFAVPAYLESVIYENQGSRMAPMFEAIFARRIHWFEWLGTALGLIGVFFAIRNYLIFSNADYKERSIVGFIARLLSRNIN
jgi:drug/metabolite transporter (DMT)-like permease